jgi:hypothetical protein
VETSFFVGSVEEISNKQTPWPESENELHRPSDCRLSAKLVPTSADRGYRVVSATVPYGRIHKTKKWIGRRKRKEKKKQPENRIFQRKFMHMNRPFIASVK